jgi:hypothetical protein
MKSPLAIVLLAVAFTGCYTPQQKQEHARYVARERDEWERANYEYYLDDYAYKRNKTIAQLTPAERQQAREQYLRDRR